MFRRLAPYLVVFAGLGFFACVGYFAYLARTSPQHANALTGHVTQMNDHGYAFYVLSCLPFFVFQEPMCSIET